MRATRTLGWAGGLMATGGLAACRPAAAPVAPPAVVVLLVDGLRADRLPPAASAASPAVHLTAWAQSATRFTTTRAPSSGTVPSVAALLARDRPDRFAPHDHLAHHAEAHGWHTTLLASNLFLGPPFGLTGGFTDAEHRELAPAAVQVDRAMEVLDARTTPTLVVVQLVDLLQPAATGDPAPPTARLSESRSLALRQAFDRAPPTPAERAFLAARYDARLTDLDRALAPLLDHIDGETVLVVTAPHGEELGERGSVGHGTHLTEEQVRVPLVIGGPGWADRTVAHPVDLADVGATVAALVEAVPADDTLGRDLRTLDSPGWTDRPTVLGPTLYGPARVGLVDGDRKWITACGDTWTLDLAADPHELHPDRTPDWTGPLRTEWATATGLPARRVLHIEVQPGTATAEPLTWQGPARLEVHHPAGLVDLWAPPLPIHRVPWEASGGPTTVEVRAVQDRLPRELLLQLATPADLTGLTVSTTVGGETTSATWHPTDPPARLQGGTPALTVGPETAPVRLTPTWAPAPWPDVRAAPPG